MKIKYAIAASLLLSVSAFAQKDELKDLKKLAKKDVPTVEDVQKAGDLLKAVEPKMANADTEQKADYHYYKGLHAMGQMATNTAAGSNAVKVAIENFAKVIEIEKSGKRNHTKDIEELRYPQLKGQLQTVANSLNQQQKFKEASPIFEMAYKLDPKDSALLYNAAATAVNAQDYDTALRHYQELDRIGFTGEGTLYTAKNKQTNEVESFPNDETRKAALLSGQYTEPKDEVLPSLRGDIVKNIALIYVQKGETEKAKQAMTDARKANPDDVNLIIAEADLYLKTKDMVTYKRLISEAIQKNPNDANLLYNLGVVTSETDTEEAINYYKKALAVEPNYTEALINLGILTLKDEKKIVDQMNSLGTTAKENKLYDELKAKRDALYINALPYFERAHKIKPDNQDVISLMMTVYQALDRQEEYKAMKAKLKQ